MTYEIVKLTFADGDTIIITSDEYENEWQEYVLLHDVRVDIIM